MFNLLANQVIASTDVLVMSETIQDLSTPFGKNRDQYGGGLVVSVREDIPQLKVFISN